MDFFLLIPYNWCDLKALFQNPSDQVFKSHVTCHESAGSLMKGLLSGLFESALYITGQKPSPKYIFPTNRDFDTELT